MYVYAFGCLRKKIEDVYICHWLFKNIFSAKTTVAVVDGLWMYICVLGYQTLENSSIFVISKWSPRKTVGTQRVNAYNPI